MRELECARCGGIFDLEADHTEIVRRDFQGQPQPAAVEHLCTVCWRAYVEKFLGQAFDVEGVREETFGSDRVPEEAFDEN